MQQRIQFTALALLILSSAVNAQNAWVPPVYLNGSNQCDNTPWKLVLYDEFNGNKIDSTKWNTYQTWDGMYVIRGTDTIRNIPEHPYWSEARATHGFLFKDENVVVNGGTCKILLKNDPNCTWTFRDSTKVGSPLMTITGNSSTGTITTPYHNPNGTPNYFSSGKFESQIKFPTFKGSWCAFWVWNGAGVNEIDFAESWAEHKSFPYFGARDRTQFNMHAWMPYGDVPGPGITYPGQSWWDFVTGNNFRQDDWHIYTCEWDTTSLRAYLDNALAYQLWKYYQTRVFPLPDGNGHFQLYYYNIGANCVPSAGLWKITYGYPFKNNSECQLRLGGGFSATNEPSSNGVFTKGQMEIDYVKVWQKHPEQDGHTDLCGTPAILPTLGNPIVAGDQSYVSMTVSHPVTGGTWSCGPYLSLSNVSGNTATFMVIAPPAPSGPISRTIYYSYGTNVAGCPPKVVSRSFTLNIHGTNSHHPVILLNAKMPDSRLQSFLFGKIDPSPDRGMHNDAATYSWTIKYATGTDTPPRNLTTYATEGKFASLSNIDIVDDKYYMEWQLDIKTQYGESASYSGVRTSGSDLNQQPGNDALWYFDAVIPDQSRYESAVSDQVATMMVGDDATSVDIQSMINQVKIEELEPYLVIDSPKSGNKLANGSNNASIRLYPNPAFRELFVLNAEDQRYAIYDISGRVLLSGKITTHAIDIAPLSSGLYLLKINNQAFRFVKK